MISPQSRSKSARTCSALHQLYSIRRNLKHCCSAAVLRYFLEVKLKISLKSVIKTQENRTNKLKSSHFIDSLQQRAKFEHFCLRFSSTYFPIPVKQAMTHSPRLNQYPFCFAHRHRTRLLWLAPTKF